MECYCYLRCVHNEMAGDKTEKCGVQFDGPLILVGDEVSYKPTSSHDESGLHQFDKKCFLEYSWVMSYVRVEDSQVTFSTRTAKNWTTCQPPTCKSKGSSTEKSHKKERCCFHVRRRISQIFDLLRPHHWRNLVEEEGKKEEETFF